MAICKKCSGELVSRGISNRPGELLFDCPKCDERWQGHTRMGYLHLYQVKIKSPFETKSLIKSVRIKPSKEALAIVKGGVQAIIDKELGQ